MSRVRSSGCARAPRALRPRRMLGTAAVTLAVLLGVSSPASAQARISTSVDATTVTVGDRITMTVSVEHPPGTTVVWPDSVALGPFEVLGARATAPAAADRGLVSTLALSLAAFELGALEIPSFEVAVAGPGGETEVLGTDRFGVEVVSVGQDEAGDIRDIRGPLSIPVGVGVLLLTVLLTLLLAGLAYMAYKRLRRRGDDHSSRDRSPPPRPAHELALEALAALEASPMLERGQVKEYHIEVSEIVRTYVERRFRVDALEMTTVEVLAGLERAGVEPLFTDGLGRFLRACDLVKFAKARPTVEASQELLRAGRRLIEDSIPLVPIPDVDVGDAAARGHEGSPGSSQITEPSAAPAAGEA